MNETKWTRDNSDRYAVSYRATIQIHDLTFEAIIKNDGYSKRAYICQLTHENRSRRITNLAAHMQYLADVKSEAIAAAELWAQQIAGRA